MAERKQMDQERSKTGIIGLDDVLNGGLIPHRLYLVEGSPVPERPRCRSNTLSRELRERKSAFTSLFRRRRKN